MVTVAAPTVRRQDILCFRYRQHQLDREPGSAAGPTDVDLLDYGVQDTGPDGSAWALRIRGVEAPTFDELALAWTLRGAPHAYRRSELAQVAVATAPLSEADAGKRMFDAVKPLKAAGIPALEALRVVAHHLRAIVAKPTVKGEASSRLTALVEPPYLRSCRPCHATHTYEMPFRLAALQAGLELEAGTSPPVLRRVPRLKALGFKRLAGDAEDRFDVLRNHLRFYGPARIADAATFLDASPKDVKAHWPADAVEVLISDEPAAGRPQPRFLLPEHLDPLMAGGGGEDRTLRLLGPYDPYLQLRDRPLLVADEAHRRDLWRVLGRPGAIVADGEIIGTWRPRTSGRRLTVAVQPWSAMRSGHRPLLAEQAERLAAHRKLNLAGTPDA